MWGISQKEGQALHNYLYAIAKSQFHDDSEPKYGMRLQV